MDKEIYNDELKIDLMKIKIDNNPDTEESIINNILKATFIVPVEKNGKKDEVEIVLLTNPNDEHYFQAYTDMDEYKKWYDYKKYDTFYFTFDQYANSLINGEDFLKGMVINPFSENISFNRDSIKYIFNSNKTSVEIINKYPKEELKVIKSVLKEIKEVKKAYLLKMLKNNISGYLLVIDTEKKNNIKVFTNISNEIKSKIEKINIDITDVNDKNIKPLLENMKTIYKV